MAADWRGAALETLLFHELRVHNTTAGKHRPITYYRTAAGVEIDLVVETAKQQPGKPPPVVCIELKHSERWQTAWERPMRSLAECGGIEVQKMFGVYRGSRVYYSHGVDILPVEDFLIALHKGEVF